MKKAVFFLIIILSFTSGFSGAQRNTDSLWMAWQDEKLHDTLRLQAIHDFAWEGYGYSKPDSAYYFAAQMYDFAKSRKLASWMVKALNVQGNTLVIRAKYLQAYNCYRQSLEISEASGIKPDIAVALHRIGIIYYYQGDIPRAIDYYTRSLKIREEIKDKKGISASVNNLGIVYSEKDMYPEALKYFLRSLQLCRELGDERGVASALNNIGLVYKAQGNAEKAYEYYTQSMNLSQKLNDKRDIAAAVNNIAHIYELKGEYDKALSSFHKSVELKSEIGDRLGMAMSLVNIGNIYERQSKYTDAVKFCSEAYEISDQIGALTEQQKACECLYRTYKGQQIKDKALMYHEKMLQLNDSLQSEETSRLLQHMEFARQMLADSIARAGEKEKIQALHKEEVLRKTRLRNVFIIATLLLLAGAGALYARMQLIRKSRGEIAKEKEQAEKLLLNILPREIANELKQNGEATPRKFENVTILFTDFQDFTRIASGLSPEKLLAELNECFREFDQICAKYKIEKIKTIGDSYMAAGGLPLYTPDSVKNTVMAAMEMNEFMLQRLTERSHAGIPCFAMRTGIHTGTVVAGIVGLHKWQYDVWGDTVNTASRIENAGVPGRVNISKSTYEMIRDDKYFSFEHRGELMVKGKGCTEMYFVEVVAVS